MILNYNMILKSMVWLYNWSGDYEQKKVISKKKSTKFRMDDSMWKLSQLVGTEEYCFEKGRKLNQFITKRGKLWNELKWRGLGKKNCMP